MELKEFNTQKRKRFVPFFNLKVDQQKEERRMRRQLAHDLQFNRDAQKRMPTVAKTFNAAYLESKAKLGPAKAMEKALHEASKAVQVTRKS